ncbi:XK-related protein 9 [Gastrophryne carolinensis]
MNFTKWNFFMTIFGVFSFLFDIGMDLWITYKYFQEELVVFGLLTIFFVLISTLIIQVFSYVWFKDDCDQDSSGKLKCIAVLHLFMLGTYVRYWYVVKFGYQVIYNPKKKNCMETKKRAIYAITDLSMLRFFKTYLESMPQLILQIYILIEHGEITVAQYASILASVSSIAWSTVDYQMCLRKSLEEKKGMGLGITMFSYILYKLFTLTSWIVSIVFLLTCNVHGFTTLVLVLVLAGIWWAWKEQTDFCTSDGIEFLYRAVVGVILAFTFFNIKGSKTRVPMTIYYVFRVLASTGILILCFYIKPSFAGTLLFTILSISTVVALGLGIIFLILYYACFHPRYVAENMADTVDGPTCPTNSNRLKQFLKP